MLKKLEELEAKEGNETVENEDGEEGEAEDGDEEKENEEIASETEEVRRNLCFSFKQLLWYIKVEVHTLNNFLLIK